MKKTKNKILKTTTKFFRIIYRILDLLLITPISKAVYWILDVINNRSGNLDKFLNNPNTLVYISLFFAFLAFFAIDLKAVNLSETEAIVLTNQEIKAEYNEEAFVVEGIPEHADIVLMGKKSSLYLAEQLGDHRLTLDLTGLGAGTHKVNIKYNNPINTLDYKLDPSRVTIVIYPKVSISKTVTTDILNTDKLDSKLVISSVELNKTEVIIKSYKEKLETVASVKALVDANALNATKAGVYTLDNVSLMAYDEKGTEIKDIEIVPDTVTATVTVKSPSKSVPITVVPVGTVSSGSAIASITPNVSTVTLYGDEDILKNIEDVKVEIDVEGLRENKTYQETISRPNGIRSMSETAITIKVTMQEETTREFLNVPIDIENLDTSKFTAKAVNVEDTSVDVVVKGVKSLLDKLTMSDIKAYVDLSDIDEVTTIDVPVLVTGTDNKLVYTVRKTRVKIKIDRKTN